jgi:hypothetical protein
VITPPRKVKFCADVIPMKSSLEISRDYLPINLTMVFQKMVKFPSRVNSGVVSIFHMLDLMDILH